MKPIEKLYFTATLAVFFAVATLFTLLFFSGEGAIITGLFAVIAIVSAYYQNRKIQEL